MQKILIALCCVAIAFSAQAQNGNKSKKTSNTDQKANITLGAPVVKPSLPVLTNAKDSASYAYGIVLGNNLARQISSSMDKEMMLLALNAVLKGDSVLLNNDVASVCYTEYNKKQSEKEGAANRQIGTDFLTNNKKRPEVKTTASGLQYEIISLATANSQPSTTPTPQDRVKVHYRGTNIDGSEFDSSLGKKTPAEFRVNQVIKGWTEGLQLMHPGDKFKFYIPTELAYNDRSPTPKIKPYAALIFEVELIEVIPGK
jgi:FKBP-type peptidyl-prolyl cis-trans isomerase FklB